MKAAHVGIVRGEEHTKIGGKSSQDEGVRTEMVEK